MEEMIQQQTIKEAAASLAEEVRDIRRQIHCHPELSFQEIETARLVHEKLTEWGIEHQTGVAGTGVVAHIKGNNPDSCCIALRADMDALPIEETESCPYRSEVNGVMHACGHDAHTAMLLGVAKILNTLKDSFEGSVRLIFQPGEEKLPGGAKAMIESGVLENVDAIFAQHCYPDLPCGSIGVCSGSYMASSNEINISIKGKGGHAAKPEHTQDMVWIAAKTLTELQFKVRNFMTQKTPYLLRFGQFMANGTYNVVPDEITIKGTFRTYDEQMRHAAIIFMESLVKEEAHYFGVNAEVKIDEGYPFLYNDKMLKKHVKQEAVDYLGQGKVVELEPLFTSEDFAWYSHQVPAFFYRLGTSNKAKGIVGKQHTSTYDIDEDCLETGMGLMAWIAVSQLASKHEE